MSYFIGWDVGGWNCDNNANSRDAVVIVNANKQVLGKPWRGNLRTTINQASSSLEFVSLIFKLCCIDSMPTETDEVVLGIDIPLGFSDEFTQLLTRQQPVKQINSSVDNPYLFRYTERFLFSHGLKPLSSIKDMIGSQTTKGLHVLAKFFPNNISAGVWQAEPGFKAIEAYPSAGKCSHTVMQMALPYLAQPALKLKGKAKYEFTPNVDMQNLDKFDALLCAFVAWLYANQQNSLVMPPAEAIKTEGWIFVPRDSLQKLDVN